MLSSSNSFCAEKVLCSSGPCNFVVDKVVLLCLECLLALCTLGLSGGFVVLMWFGALFGEICDFWCLHVIWNTGEIWCLHVIWSTVWHGLCLHKFNLTKLSSIWSGWTTSSGYLAVPLMDVLHHVLVKVSLVFFGLQGNVPHAWHWLQWTLLESNTICGNISVFRIIPTTSISNFEDQLGSWGSSSSKTN